MKGITSRNLKIMEQLVELAGGSSSLVATVVTSMPRGSTLGDITREIMRRRGIDPSRIGEA